MPLAVIVVAGITLNMKLLPLLLLKVVSKEQACWCMSPTTSTLPCHLSTFQREKESTCDTKAAKQNRKADGLIISLCFTLVPPSIIMSLLINCLLEFGRLKNEQKKKDYGHTAKVQSCLNANVEWRK